MFTWENALPYMYLSVTWMKIHLYLFFFRFDVPGINAMNFLLHRALGGGGIASLRSDPQVMTQKGHAMLTSWLSLLLVQS